MVHIKKKKKKKERERDRANWYGISNPTDTIASVLEKRYFYF